MDSSRVEGVSAIEGVSVDLQGDMVHCGMVQASLLSASPQD